MKVTLIDPPREFTVRTVQITHCADVELAPDEQVTFVTPSGTEFDVVRKEWGYYGSPSLNQRLPDHGLRPVLVRGRSARMYLLLVEPDKMREFEEYIDWDGLRVVCWLDRMELTDEVARKLGAL